MKKKYVISSICGAFLLSCVTSHAVGLPPSKMKYRTNFGDCPSRTAGQLSMKLIKNFEENKSLKKLKSEIVDQELAQSHFISSYKIKFSPVKNSLNFSFTCPKPLMKVQVYKKNGLDSYEAILVENGQLFDPTYEVLLRSDRKLKRDLPFLALPVGSIDKEVKPEVVRVVKKMGLEFRQKVSEVILDDKGELTIILSMGGSPSSVFMGKGEWLDKTTKLKRIVKNMEKNKRVPAIINMTNAKKIVVKFNTNI